MSETCRVIINQVKQKLHLVGYLLSLYVVKHRGMKAYGGTGDTSIALLVIYLGTRLKWLVSFKPRPLSPPFSGQITTLLIV